MHVDYAFLCDAANEQGGKINALGLGVDRLTTAELPATHGHMTFVARIGFVASDAGTHPFSLRVVDADGGQVVPPIAGELHLVHAPEAPAPRINLIVELQSLRFTIPGPHEVSLAIDGMETVTLPLEVARA